MKDLNNLAKQFRTIAMENNLSHSELTSILDLVFQSENALLKTVEENKTKLLKTIQNDLNEKVNKLDSFKELSTNKAISEIDKKQLAEKINKYMEKTKEYKKYYKFYEQYNEDSKKIGTIPINDLEKYITEMGEKYVGKSNVH
jgi:hypothetical protein